MTRPRQHDAVIPPGSYLPETPPAQSTQNARQRCYEAIKADMLAGVSRYYAEHSQRLGDERSADAIAWSRRGMERILLILNGFEIQDLPDRTKETAP